MTIYRGPGGSGDATNDATVTAVAAYAAQAATSATNAANSATTSGTSATNSANSASSAAASASAAATSASQAASSQSAAATSATTAASSATSAGTQATNATTQANNAANSATAAATSASNASTSATNAATSASQAATSATNASNSAASALAIYGNTTAMNNAVTSATNSASAAATSASQAAASANDASDEATQAGIYAGQAASSASAAANSAANSQAAVGDALALYGSAAALQTAVTNAQTSATQSANSATASSASSSAAQTSANAAATSATNAANSATQAANSAASAAAIVTGVASNRPSIRPSLLLDFSNTKQLDPRITFSRPTTATYYDGKTVVKAEENLVQYSQEFDNAVWQKASTTVTANSTTAPDGTTTADTVTYAASAAANIRYPLVLAAGTYTFSVYAKVASGTKNFLFARYSNGAGYLESASLTATTTWQRFTFTATASAESNTWYILNDAAGTAGDLIVWGAQLELRSTVTAYTPTTTAPITNYIPALQTAVSNDARFDHDPVTGESKGLLIEEQRTNLCLRSQDFENASWTKSNTSISSLTVAPDGTLSAAFVQENTTNNPHGILSPAATNPQSNGLTSLSIYLKYGGKQYVALTNTDQNYNFGTLVDLINGTIVTTAWSDGTGTPDNRKVSITSVGNGWYRVSISYSDSGAWQFSVYNRLSVMLYNGNALTTENRVYTGNGYAGVYVWGGQSERGAFPTSYIPTVASQVTRSADSASMTGSNFSGWYRADEGTVYSETAQLTPSSSYFGTFSISDGSNTNRLYHEYGPTSQLYVMASNTTSADIDCGNTSQGVFAKLATAYKTNDFAAVLNGGTVFTDTSGNIPTVNKVNIGGDAGGAVNYSGIIKRIAYYPKRLSNTELQGLTS